MSLECSNRLGFHRPFNQTVRERLLLQNPNNFDVTFKVKTTAPRHYCVRPNVGRVEANRDLEVQVLLQAMAEEPPSNAKCKDKFLVQSLPITKEMADLPLHDIWSRLNDFREYLHEKKIRCVYLAPGDTEEADSSRITEDALNESRDINFESIYQVEDSAKADRPAVNVNGISTKRLSSGTSSTSDMTAEQTKAAVLIGEAPAAASSKKQKFSVPIWLVLLFVVLAAIIGRML